MSIIAYFEASLESASAAKKGLFRRFLDRIAAGQEARANAELKRHSHLLPRELDQLSWNIGERSEDSLPFIR
jgi:hypothetical protein